MNKKYVVIKIYPMTMIINIVNDRRIVLERRYDLMEINERNKRHISAFMKFYRDLPLITTWEDLQYIRSIGIRI